MHRKKVNYRDAIHLKEGDDMITEKEAVAEILNEYYSEVHSRDRNSKELTVS